jgi:hypothetical protein
MGPVADDRRGTCVDRSTCERNRIAPILTEVSLGLTGCPLCSHPFCTHVHRHHDPWVVGRGAGHVPAHGLEITRIWTSLGRRETKECHCVVICRHDSCRESVSPSDVHARRCEVALRRSESEVACIHGVVVGYVANHRSAL